MTSAYTFVRAGKTTRLTLVDIVDRRNRDATPVRMIVFRTDIPTAAAAQKTYPPAICGQRHPKKATHIGISIMYRFGDKH